MNRRQSSTMVINLFLTTAALMTGHVTRCQFFNFGAPPVPYFVNNEGLFTTTKGELVPVKSRFVHPIHGDGSVPGTLAPVPTRGSTTRPIFFNSMATASKQSLDMFANLNKPICPVPNIDNGALFQGNEFAEPGQLMRSGSILVLSCRPDFVLNPPENFRAICSATGKWVGTLGSCVSLVLEASKPPVVVTQSTSTTTTKTPATTRTTPATTRRTTTVANVIDENDEDEDVNFGPMVNPGQGSVGAWNGLDEAGANRASVKVQTPKRPADTTRGQSSTTTSSKLSQSKTEQNLDDPLLIDVDADNFDFVRPNEVEFLKKSPDGAYEYEVVEYVDAEEAGNFRQPSSRAVASRAEMAKQKDNVIMVAIVIAIIAIVIGIVIAIAICCTNQKYNP